MTVGGEEYVIASEAARRLRVSRMTFYRNYKHLLQAFRIGARRRVHYKMSDVERLNRVEPIEQAS